MSDLIPVPWPCRICGDPLPLIEPTCDPYPSQHEGCVKICDGCGGDDRQCPYVGCPKVIVLDGLPLADLKAIFARADLSLMWRDCHPVDEGKPK